MLVFNLKLQLCNSSTSFGVKTRDFQRKIILLALWWGCACSCVPRNKNGGDIGMIPSGEV